MTACVLLMVVVYPSFLMASSALSAASIIGVMLAVGAVLCGVVTAALLSEVFPTRTRYTASAITYNMAYTLAAPAPLMATWLISTTGSNLSPAFYLIVVALMALAGGWRCRKRRGFLLHDTGPAPARQAAFKGGLPESAGAVTLSKMCGSAMRAVMFGHDMPGCWHRRCGGGRWHGKHDQRPMCCPRHAAVTASATTASTTT